MAVLADRYRISHWAVASLEAAYNDEPAIPAAFGSTCWCGSPVTTSAQL